MFVAARMSLHQLEHLRLDRDVERRRRLVGDQELGIAGERHGDHHALAHPAGELVRIGVDAARRVGDADELEQLQHLARRRASRPMRSCRRIASPIWSPIVMTGLSELIGSWKIMAMSRPRISGIRARGRAADRRLEHRSGPATIRPGGSGIRRRIDSDVTDLPDPDSPTMPTAAPACNLEADAVDGADGVALRAELDRKVLDREKRRRSSRRLGIEHVAHGVAEHVEGEHDDGDGETRADDRPG